MNPRICALIALGASVAGCAAPENHAIFVTKTSLAIVDADTTPPGVSIGYDRAEGYVGPRFDDGTVAPVAGSFETDGKIFNRKIRQVYATGCAAEIATTPKNETIQRPNCSGGLPSELGNKVMFFGTGTVLGVKIGFLDGNVVPNSFSFGYRRKEASIIPVEKLKFPSVIATLDNSIDVNQAATASHDVAFGVSQFFATGTAADRIATLAIVRQAFSDKAAQAMAPVLKFRIEEALQGREALDTLACLSRVPDDRLNRVWNNAEDLGLFTSANLPESIGLIREAKSSVKQRELYTTSLHILNPDSPEHTQALRAHRTAVCRLAEK